MGEALIESMWRASLERLKGEPGCAGQNYSWTASMAMVAVLLSAGRPLACG